MAYCVSCSSFTNAAGLPARAFSAASAAASRVAAPKSRYLNIIIWFFLLYNNSVLFHIVILPRFLLLFILSSLPVPHHPTPNILTIMLAGMFL